MTNHARTHRAAPRRWAKIGLAAACLAGAATAYLLLSRPPAPGEQELQAGQHADAVRESMEHAAPQEQAPPESTRTAPRGPTSRPAPQ